MLAIEDKMYRIRDMAMIRNIELTSKVLRLKNRLDNARSPKQIDKYTDEIEYVESSIESNREIIFKVADLDKDYQLEQ
jgi:DNA-binding protein H-NS